MFLDTNHVDPPPTLFEERVPPPPPASFTAHRELRRDPFWRSLPGYHDVGQEEFGTHTFQQRRTVTNVRQLRETVGSMAPDSFYEDLAAGMANAPMALRISPYLLGLIDWTDPVNDPIRTQFLPLRSQQLPDHPMGRYDSLNEQGDSPVPGLTHRYRDKALFLPLDNCPVYCRFCTRSYAIGAGTELNGDKLKFGANTVRWELAFEYIAAHEELEDIVVSGGDTYNLKAEHLRGIGERLLRIPHIRRIRFATKGLCVLPQKILTDLPWVEALAKVVALGRELHKDVVVHTHFNHPGEITGFTQDAMDRLVERGVHVRCQTVLQRTVNDAPATMQLLVRRLSFVNVHPYYVYFHDMVPGVEDLRTSLGTGLKLEKLVRGHTAGFNTPAFVVDTMGGGGKRDAHSYEHYNPQTGIAVFTSPSVRPGKKFLYFDPLCSLNEEHQWRWTQPTERAAMVDEALAEGTLEAQDAPWDGSFRA